MHDDLDYAGIFEAIRHSYLILSRELIIIGANQTYLAATLTQRDAIIGRHLFDVFSDNPDDPTANGVRNPSASLDRVIALGRLDAMPIHRYDIRRPDGNFEERFGTPSTRQSSPTEIGSEPSFTMLATLQSASDGVHPMRCSLAFPLGSRSPPLGLQPLGSKSRSPTGSSSRPETTSRRARLTCSAPVQKSAYHDTLWLR